MNCAETLEYYNSKLTVVLKYSQEMSLLFLALCVCVFCFVICFTFYVLKGPTPAVIICPSIPY